MKTKLINSLLPVLFVATVVMSLAAFRNASANRNAIKAVRAVQKIEFDFARSGVRKSYYPELDKLAESMKSEKFTLALRGHADSIGSYVGNWKLSEKRANNVKQYLIEKGVNASKIVTTPFGSTIPVASNKTPEGRQKNRRVEINIAD